MCFDKTVQVVQKQKISSTSILDKHRMLLKRKARMNIPLCQMISMPIMCPALKIDVLKMERAFQTRYHEEEKVFHVSPLNWKGEEQFFDSYVDLGTSIGVLKNEKSEHFLFGDPDFKFLSSHMFFVWDGNHMLQAWLLYIQHVHYEDPKWHYSMIPLCLTPHVALWSSSSP
jgi:hypothetical protein